MNASPNQSAKWQARAAIPEDEFYATLAAGKSTDTLLKQKKREQWELDLGTKQLSLPTKKYGVTVEDFEWDFEVYSRETGMDRHAANHYSVSEYAHSVAEILERTKVRFECAAEDCVLFMLATVPTLAIAIDVLRLRGFKYVSNSAARISRGRRSRSAIPRK